jgi:hypothetical protein
MSCGVSPHSDISFNERSLNKRRIKQASGQHPWNETVATPRPGSRAEHRSRTEARILGGAAQVIEIRPLMGRNQRDEGRLTGDTATGVAVRASLEAFSSGR